MSAWMKRVREVLDGLTALQKIKLAVAALATLGLIWGTVAYTNRIRYDVLYSAVAAEDAADVLAALRQRNVAYRLSPGGKVIEVPAERVDELRMQLAGEGLPRGGGIGFEIFDKPAFGVSAFVQNVNYRRALEWELGRSVQSFVGVESARVHLAIPPESVFADEQKDASASVVVRMHSERALGKNEVRAIQHLVASGVEELAAAQVSVIDGQGRMLSEVSVGEGDDRLSASQDEAKQDLEQRIESVLLAILEPVVGLGKVRARATVELETAQVQRIEERYDPDGAVVRSEQKNKSKNGGSAAAGGAPGSDANLPQGSAVAGAGPSSETNSSTINFEINKTVETIQEPRGRLLRQSVAVVVAHVAPPKSSTADGDASQEASEQQATEPIPRTAEEMQKITALVRAAVGIDESRGDQLIVEQISFDQSLSPPIDVAHGMDWVGLIIQVLRYLTLPLAVVLIALLVIRPALAALRSAQTKPRELGTVPTVAQLQAELADGAPSITQGGSGLRQKLIEAASQDPEAAALVVGEWFDAPEES